jgi:small subunit ribosomal protein S15
MSRVYSKSKGKAGSKKPKTKTVPSWVRYQTKEIELLITKLAKEGKSPSKIGLYLRDEYGIPDVKLITKKRINEILKEKSLLSAVPEDLMALIKRSVAIRKHIKRNHKDTTAGRGLAITESKINRLIKYYKAKKVLPENWKYDPEKVSLVVE